MIISDAKEASSKTEAPRADFFLTGYSSKSLEFLWDKNHVIYRNTLRNFYARLYTASMGQSNSHLILYSAFWSSDYLRNPSVTSIQKLFISTIKSHNNITYIGNRIAIDDLLGKKFNFSIYSVLYSSFFLGKKILATGFRYFLNRAGPLRKTYSNLFYTIPSALNEKDSRLECRYWGNDFNDVMNSHDSCFFLRGDRGNSEIRHNNIHELALLPYYLFPQFLYLCIRDFFSRVKILSILARERKMYELDHLGESLVERCYLMSLADDLVKDSVEHVLYRMIGQALGERLTGNGRVYLLSENQSWERSLQAGLSETNFSGVLINFYHAGIKPNECRYDLHRDLVDWGHYSHKNIFVGTTESVVCFDSQLDFFVPNRKLERTCGELQKAFSANSDPSGILVFGDINKELTLQMLQAVFAHKNEFGSELVAVRWHPAWSNTDIRRCRNALKKFAITDFVDARDSEFEWSVSCCFSTASLDSKHLGMRICIFSKPEWLNIIPLPLMEVEKMIFPDSIVSRSSEPNSALNRQSIINAVCENKAACWADIVTVDR